MTLSVDGLWAKTWICASGPRLVGLEIATDVESEPRPVCASANVTTQHFADWFVSNPLARAYSRPLHLGVSQNLR